VSRGLDEENISVGLPDPLAEKGGHFSENLTKRRTKSEKCHF
jgi:hypothetical protein